MIGQIRDVGRTRQEPQKLVNDPFEENFLGRDQGKSGTQVKTHLMTKYAVGACARSIGFESAVFSNMAHQIEVLLHGRCLRCAKGDINSDV